MIGLHKEGQGREDEAQILDSLNDDALLRLHYGLHVTLQVAVPRNVYTELHEQNERPNVRKF